MAKGFAVWPVDARLPKELSLLAGTEEANGFAPGCALVLLVVENGLEAPLGCGWPKGVGSGCDGCELPKGAVSLLDVFPNGLAAGAGLPKALAPVLPLLLLLLEPKGLGLGPSWLAWPKALPLAGAAAWPNAGAPKGLGLAPSALG